MRYNYDSSETQYLRPPYEYFAIDLTVKYVLRIGCVPGEDYIPDGVCAKPTNVSLRTAVNVTTATLGWEGQLLTGTAGFELQVQLAGVPPVVSAWKTVSRTTTLYTFTGLTAGTDYTFYIKKNCVGSNSGWVSFNFSTTN